MVHTDNSQSRKQKTTWIANIFDAYVKVLILLTLGTSNKGIFPKIIAFLKLNLFFLGTLQMNQSKCFSVDFCFLLVNTNSHVFHFCKT